MLNSLLVKELLSKQKELDNFIISKKKVKSSEKNKKIDLTKLALLVEIGEFANELSTFKSWKKEKKIDYKKAKEELIDCLHFFLSLCGDFSENFFNEYKSKKRNQNIHHQFNELLMNFFSATFLLEKKIDENERKIIFYNWLTIFEELSFELGMKDEKDIREIYNEKNNKNFERIKEEWSE